jgi:hypothetical protein
VAEINCTGAVLLNTHTLVPLVALKLQLIQLQDSVDEKEEAAGSEGAVDPSKDTGTDTDGLTVTSPYTSTITSPRPISVPSTKPRNMNDIAVKKQHADTPFPTDDPPKSDSKRGGFFSLFCLPDH